LSPFVNRQFTQKKESFSALFDDAVSNIDYGKLLPAVKTGTEFLEVFSISSASVIHFVFFAVAVRAFDFHNITSVQALV
jgi:hypothetical protein